MKQPKGAQMSKRIETLLDRMSLDEQVSLLAGLNMWNTVPIERLDIPRMRVSDGPAGVRGSRFDGPASMNVPCGTAIAASWNRNLVRQLGELLGREMIAKGAKVHLAPTVNLHRTPVGGRNFECMSEDPFLTAMTGLEYVRGVQSTGVASCIKHFVGNDTEFERMTIDSQIDERTLREMYLAPFERAVLDGEVMSVMTAYNRINGPYAADSEYLLKEVLREEWGFDGVVISDWFGLHSTAEGVIAGCDLEMPGPTAHRGQKLLDAVANGDVSPEHVRDCARHILNVMERTGALDETPPAETSRDDEEDLALLRTASAAGMVLLRNEHVGNVPALPLVAGNVSSIAVLGPNAATGMVMGGGSAHVTPTRVSHPLDALRNRLGHVFDIHHAPGCSINKKLPELDARLVTDVVVDYFNHPEDLDNPAAPPDVTGTTGVFRILWVADPVGRRGGGHSFGARFSMQFTPDVPGTWAFSVESVSPVQLKVNGEIILDNTDLPAGGSFFGTGKPEMVTHIDMEAGQTYSLTAEVRHSPSGMGLSGINIGAMAPLSDHLFSDAVDLAAACDLSIVVVGTNDDWESEGWDRTDISLPGDQDLLVAEVAKVSQRTIVVVNAGSPVSMPWINDVDAVLFVWFPGQEMGDALVDILMGVVEPSGRLPVTLPHRLEDTPAYEHHPGRNGVAQYREGRLIGYRWYDTVGKEPLFPFGFGLGYAQVNITQAEVMHDYAVEVTVENTSMRSGVEVVQVYAHLLNRDGLAPDEPMQRLVGYGRVEVGAQSVVVADIAIDRDAYRTWSVEAAAWQQWQGPIELRIGTSSRHIAQTLQISM
jgi:beta-glucosidase